MTHTLTEAELDELESRIAWRGESNSVRINGPELRSLIAAARAGLHSEWRPIETAALQELINALDADDAPPAEGAAAEDRSSYGFEWNFKDGTKLWFDIDSTSGFSVFWKRPGCMGQVSKLRGDALATGEESEVMRAARKANDKVASWSPEKQDYARRIAQPPEDTLRVSETAPTTEATLPKLNWDNGRKPSDRPAIRMMTQAEGVERGFIGYDAQPSPSDAIAGLVERLRDHADVINTYSTEGRDVIRVAYKDTSRNGVGITSCKTLVRILTEAATALEASEREIEQIGDAVSLEIGKDCTVEQFCEAIRGYQLDSIKLDDTQAALTKAHTAMNSRTNLLIGGHSPHHHCVYQPRPSDAIAEEWRELVKQMQNPPKEFEIVPAAFVNAIAEEGSKAEAVEYLQKEWSEKFWWEARAIEAATALTQAMGEIEQLKREKTEIGLEGEKLIAISQAALAKEQAENERLRADLEEIENLSSSQPAAMNMPEWDWFSCQFHRAVEIAVRSRGNHAMLSTKGEE